MRAVISASRRTDLPAFYMPWLLDRLRAGQVEVANPFRREQVRLVSLRPEDVAWFVFWSRNYGAWLRHRQAFAEHRVAFQFTITAGNPLLEPRVPPVERAIRQAEALTRHYGGERVFWRYDPIICWRDADGRVQTNHRGDVFRQLCRELGALGVRQCTVSFAAFYRKVRVRMAQVTPRIEPLDPPTDARRRLACELRDVAGEHGITLAACCTADLLDVPGIAQSRCIDGELLSRLGGERVSCAKAATRAGCGCTASVDIGDYERQPCRYGCLYCYANPAEHVENSIPFPGEDDG